MALQSFAAPSSSGSQPTSTATNFPPPSNSSALTPGSSIPFSFLIAFIALFLFFLGCGLGTRRAAVVLRRNLGLNDSITVAHKRRAAKPAIWDAWPEMKEWNACERWDMLQPLSATYVREKSAEDDDEMNTVAHSEHLATPSRPQSLATSPLPYGAVRPVTGLTYLPSRFGTVMTLHAPPDYPRSPTSPRLSPAAVPPISPRPSPPAPRPVTPAATPSPQPHVGLLRGIRDSLRNNVYVIAMLNEIGVARGRKPRNEIIAEDLKPVEGLQVTVLVAMPSQERKLAAKLKRESTAAEGGRTSQSESGEVKEVINPADDPSEISAEFGELVIGTMKVPWEEKKLEDVD